MFFDSFIRLVLGLVGVTPLPRGADKKQKKKNYLGSHLERNQLESSTRLGDYHCMIKSEKIDLIVNHSGRLHVKSDSRPNQRGAIKKTLPVMKQTTTLNCCTLALKNILRNWPLYKFLGGN